MKEVIEEANQLVQKGEPCVLATVVRTKGMTPQKAGAKQLIRKDGSSVGTLGGGCVEGDIWFYAKQMLQEKSGPQFREYYLNEDIAAKDGLICGGTMYFFLDPICQDNEFMPFAKEIVEAYGGGSPVALATVVNSPNKDVLGKKMLIRKDGSTAGSLGNKSFRAKVAKVGKKIATFGENVTLVDDDGTEVYIEGFTTPPILVIMGGGHVGRAVYNLATTLGFRIYIVDDRPEYSNKERFPQAVETVVADFAQGLDAIPVNLNTFILVATRGHRYDDAATQAAIQTQARYIGLLGSKRKNLMIFRDLVRNKIPVERIQEINAPVGLNIGALTPEELAVSIMAEIIQCIRGGDGRPMKMDMANLLEQIEKVPEAAKTPPF
ncbi:MAG: XdhC family protein [bacterium]